MEPYGINAHFPIFLLDLLFAPCSFTTCFLRGESKPEYLTMLMFSLCCWLTLTRSLGDLRINLDFFESITGNKKSGPKFRASLKMSLEPRCISQITSSASNTKVIYLRLGEGILK